MANPPNIIREMVSGRRKRFTEGGYNLDLSYIKDNIIAMGYPADNMEAFYRNKREDVIRFLKEKHEKKYKVYNLCSERTYDATLFPHYAEYPFEDHNPPNIALINKFCEDVDMFLRADPEHVVAIHCKAGKGRTGTMICCYLLYSNSFQTANQALTYYAEKRTWDQKGVTIPSQRRYVQYYEQLLRKQLAYEDVTLYICELHISPADVPLRAGTINVKGSKESLALTEFQRSEESVTVLLDVCMPLTGDVKVEFARVRKLKEKRWHFWFNTFFVKQAAMYDSQGRLVLTLDRMEIDDAHKGNTKKCPEQVQVFLKPVPASGKYSENMTANRKLVAQQPPPPLSQPLLDGNQTYGTTNSHHLYRHHHHQLHHLSMVDPSQHNSQQQQQQLMLSNNVNFNSDPLQHNYHHRHANNNRASVGSNQPNSGAGIYGNIGCQSLDGKLQQPQYANQQQQQQQQHDAAAAASSPSSKANYEKQPLPAHQQKPQLPQRVAAATTAATTHQQLNHSGGSSEEISGTDSVEEEEEYEDGDEKDEEEEEEEEEEGWESGAVAATRKQAAGGEPIGAGPFPTASPQRVGRPKMITLGDFPRVDAPCLTGAAGPAGGPPTIVARIGSVVSKVRKFTNQMLGLGDNTRCSIGCGGHAETASLLPPSVDTDRHRFLGEPMSLDQRAAEHRKDLREQLPIERSFSSSGGLHHFTPGYDSVSASFASLAMGSSSATSSSGSVLEPTVGQGGQRRLPRTVPTLLPGLTSGRFGFCATDAEDTDDTGGTNDSALGKANTGPPKRPPRAGSIDSSSFSYAPGALEWPHQQQQRQQVQWVGQQGFPAPAQLREGDFDAGSMRGPLTDSGRSSTEIHTGALEAVRPSSGDTSAAVFSFPRVNKNGAIYRE